MGPSKYTYLGEEKKNLKPRQHRHFKRKMDQALKTEKKKSNMPLE